MKKAILLGLAAIAVSNLWIAVDVALAGYQPGVFSMTVAYLLSALFFIDQLLRRLDEVP